MEEKVESTIDDFVVKIEMTVRDLNMLLNLINAPFQGSAMMASHFIKLLQSQAGPQIDDVSKGLEAVEKANKK